MLSFAWHFVSAYLGIAAKLYCFLLAFVSACLDVHAAYVFPALSSCSCLSCSLHLLISFVLSPSAHFFCTLSICSFLSCSLLLLMSSQLSPGMFTGLLSRCWLLSQWYCYHTMLSHFAPTGMVSLAVFLNLFLTFLWAFWLICTGFSKLQLVSLWPWPLSMCSNEKCLGMHHCVENKFFIIIFCTLRTKMSYRGHGRQSDTSSTVSALWFSSAPPPPCWLDLTTLWWM